MRDIIFVISVLVLSGCAFSEGDIFSKAETPPNDISNICSILKEKPHWSVALGDVKEEFGVPPHVILATMYQESKFVSDARPIAKGLKGLWGTRFASTAFGYSQALDLTWADYKKSTGRSSARRDLFSDAAHFMGWYMARTNSKLRLSKWDAEVQYLAYHEGHGGYKKKTYKNKKWLMKVAKDVGRRSNVYWEQYQKCSGSSLSKKGFLEKYIL